MAAHLSSGRVNLTALREAGRRELREVLDKCAGTKVRGLRGGFEGTRGYRVHPAAPCRPAGHRVGRVPDRAVRADRAVLAAQGTARGSRRGWGEPWGARLRCASSPPPAPTGA